MKPIDFPNAMPGFIFLQEKLETLGVEPDQILISPHAHPSLELVRTARAMAGRSAGR
jgi:hypothetical protein